jgi:hypothetical protein
MTHILEGVIRTLEVEALAVVAVDPTTAVRLVLLASELRRTVARGRA